MRLIVTAYPDSLTTCLLGLLVKAPPRWVARISFIRRWLLLLTVSYLGHDAAEGTVA